MAGEVVNRGKAMMLEWIFLGNLPGTLALALLTNDTPPTVDHNALSDVVEVADGNGYTAGGSYLVIGTDFFALTEDDGSDYASITVGTVTWTASGGPIPVSGSNPYYAALCTLAGSLIAFGEIGSQSVSAGQDFEVKDFVLKLTET